MDTIWTLIKLQFRAGARIAREKSPARTALKWLIIIAVASVLMGGLIAVYYMLSNQFTIIEGGVDLLNEFLTFTLAAFMAIQTLFLIPLLIKVLDINNDRELLLKLPLSSRQIFISKLLVAYSFELLFTLVILGPLLIAYGAVASMAWWFFVFAIPLFIIFVPVFPFFLTILLLFPIIKLVQFLKQRTVITILVYLGALVGGIILYMQVVQGMVHAIAYDGFADTLQNNAGQIQNISRYLFPAQLFAFMVSGGAGSFFGWFAVVIAASAILLTGAFYIANLKYKKFYMEEHGTMSGFSAKGKYNGLNSSTAVLGKDSRNIFRSSNYTFQFLLIVAITPLLIFFSNRVANYAAFHSLAEYGQASMAGDMGFEITLLISIVLIPLASAFAASNISREGHNIYHTKLIPVSFRKQLFIKAGIVFVPIFATTLVGVLLSMITHRNIGGGSMYIAGLQGTDVLVLLVITTFMAIGYICLGTYIDLRKPLCNQIGTGELTKATGHANFIILLGTIIGLGFGAVALLAAFDINIVDISRQGFRIFLLIFSIVFGGTFAALLFVDGPKRYYRLEQ
ncbi:MAG: hypothetical protein FWE22_01795 [Firmicutes bacterium]|nr:hypothetical protein [Bacillota bacterium]